MQIAFLGHPRLGLQVLFNGNGAARHLPVGESARLILHGPRNQMLVSVAVRRAIRVDVHSIAIGLLGTGNTVDCRSKDVLQHGLESCQWLTNHLEGFFVKKQLNSGWEDSLSTTILTTAIQCLAFGNDDCRLVPNRPKQTRDQRNEAIVEMRRSENMARSQSTAIESHDARAWIVCRW